MILTPPGWPSLAVKISFLFREGRIRHFWKNCYQQKTWYLTNTMNKLREKYIKGRIHLMILSLWKPNKLLLIEPNETYPITHGDRPLTAPWTPGHTIQMFIWGWIFWTSKWSMGNPGSVGHWILEVCHAKLSNKAIWYLQIIPDSTMIETTMVTWGSPES